MVLPRPPPLKPASGAAANNPQDASRKRKATQDASTLASTHLPGTRPAATAVPRPGTAKQSRLVRPHQASSQPPPSMIKKPPIKTTTGIPSTKLLHPRSNIHPPKQPLSTPTIHSTRTQLAKPDPQTAAHHHPPSCTENQDPDLQDMPSVQEILDFKPSALPKRAAYDLKLKNGDLRAQNQEFRQHHQGVVRRVTHMSEELEAFKQQHEQEVRKHRDQFEEQVEKLTRQCKELKTELEDVTGDRDKIRSENRSLKEIAEDLEGQLLKRSKECKRIEEEVEELSQDLKSSKAKYKTLLEETEGMRAHNDNLRNQLEQTSKKYVETVELTIQQKEEIKVLRRKLHEADSVRRQLHNQIMELKGNIRVFCRVRPLLPKELQDPDNANVEHIKVPDGADHTDVVIQQTTENVFGKENKKEALFRFDHVFPPEAGQLEVFGEVNMLVQSALDGYHVCIFAYGQTGSGKTFTMEGEPGTEEGTGIIPRAVGQIFDSARALEAKGWEFSMKGQFLEIYNETIRDLLADPKNNPIDDSTKHEIRHLDSRHTEVRGLTVVPLQSAKQVEGLLKIATSNRAVAATMCNERSSRSHSVFTLSIEGTNKATDEKLEGVLNLIDLAGSERLSQSGSTGDRLKETQSINKSLSSLTDVIKALSSKGSHIPYRNSKLTYLLQNSLGGNAKTLMFVNISPVKISLGESLNSLKFARMVNNCQIGTAKRNVK